MTSASRCLRACTCNGEGDKALTRLQQCDLHEIIEWPVVRLEDEMQ